MICPKCGSHVNEEDQYCSQCGTYLKRCPYCLNPVEEDYTYCPSCGRSLTKQTTYVAVDDHQENKKPNFKLISISLLVLLILTALSIIHLAKTDSSSIVKDDEKKVTNKVSKTKNQTLSDQANINLNEGIVAYNQGYYYIVSDECLYKVEAKSQQSKKIVEGVSGYVQVENQKLYYCDTNHYLYECDLNGENQKELIKEALYYVHVSKDAIYAQVDQDHESIYRFDKNTLSKNKLNDRQSYNLILDASNMYYSSSDGIYCLNLLTKEDQQLFEGNVVSLIKKDQQFYFCLKTNNSYSLYTYDLNTKKATQLVDYAYLLNISDDTLYYFNTNRQQIELYNLKTKQTTLTNLSSTSVFVVNGKLIAFVQNGNMFNQTTKIQVFNLNGTNGQNLLLDGNEQSDYV